MLTLASDPLVLHAQILKKFLLFSIWYWCYAAIDLWVSLVEKLKVVGFGQDSRNGNVRPLLKEMLAGDLEK